MSAPRQTIESLHAGPWKLAFCITGGGSRIASDLLTVPGGSNTVLEITIPYSEVALDDYLRHSPDQYCSRETALSMAAAAWTRARQLAAKQSESGTDVIGIGCTASLVSSSMKRGDHRVWIATESRTRSTITTVTLSKGRRNRVEEEAVAADLILHAIAEATGVEVPVLPDLTSSEIVHVESETLPDAIADVRSGGEGLIWSIPGGSLMDSIEPLPKGLLSGSFNPLHHGHEGLRRIAERHLNGPVYFEMPIFNADKPPLDCFAIESRRAQMADTPLALTGASRFVDKARLFPGTAFVIGYDTAERVIQPRFYDDSEQEMHAAFEEIESSGCRFLVAGRKIEAVFHTLSELNIPSPMKNLFEPIPENEFRDDVSSTELRQLNPRG